MSQDEGMPRSHALGTRAREHPLQAIALTPVVTRTHLALLDIDVSEQLVPTSAHDHRATRATYELRPETRQSLAGVDSPFTEREVRDIHRAFARALSQETSDPEVGLALRHARHGEDWETLHKLWVRHGLGLVTRSAEIATWAFNALPSAATKKFPFLSLASAIFDPTLANFDTPDRRATIQTVARRASTAIHALWSNRDGAVTLHLLVGQMIHERVNGSLEKASQHGVRIATEIEKQTARGTLTDHGLLAWCEFQVSMTQLLRGETALSKSTARRAYTAALSGGIDAEYIVVNAASQLALIHALGGELADADVWIDQASRHQCAPWFDHLVRLPARIAQEIASLERLQPSPTTLEADSDSLRGTEMWPFIAQALARRKIYSGNAAGALIDIHRWRSNASQEDRFDAERLLVGPEVEALISAGEPNRAMQLVDAFSRKYRIQPKNVPGIALPYARALQHMGDITGARRLASGISRPRSDHSLPDILEARLLLAEMDAASGASHTTPHTLKTIDDSVANLDLRRLSRTISQGLVEVLANLPGGSSLATWAQAGSSAAIFPAVNEPPRLTSRELIVLQHLAQGSPLAAIAGDLGLSINTIKTQVASIYRKLGVSTRALAVQAAHQKGLLS